MNNKEIKNEDNISEKKYIEDKLRKTQIFLETGGITTSIYPKALKKKLFPALSNADLVSNLKMDEVGKYSISLPRTAEIITKIINDHINKISTFKDKQITITDATAGIGGNTISFAQKFHRVNSVELNYNRYLFLVNNINIYNLENINVYNKDYIQIMQTLKQDVLFIDPPWGGKSYKKKKKINIKLSQMSLETICQNMKDKCKLIVLKIPLNYDIDNFIKSINATIYQYKIRKMYIFILEF
ncbi:RNA cap guanine-N2 methyltransferase [seawater metagenome]|uniref:RNA cap guanine-N2 methyltransferase n=1 Tax=seawater metagenome TaxID=1561972 RepID=A0A5E8CL85_9ZZZZ